MARRERKSKTRVREVKIGLWTMVRDVLVASLNKGQFPVALIAAIIIVALWRMPREEVGRLAFEVVDRLVDLSLVGWVGCALLALAWRGHAHRQRKLMMAEVDRIARERTRLQEEVHGAPLKSSDKS